MKNVWVKFRVFVLLLAPLFAHAGGDEVVVLYNTRVPGSRDVAEYYAKARNVPSSQLYDFSLTASEEMSRDEFTGSLQLSLMRRLVSDGLWELGSFTVPATSGKPEHTERRVVKSKIRYAVLCYGMPLKIAANPNLREMVSTNFPVEWQRNDASVDSELAWLPFAEMDLPLSKPLPNWVYATTNAAMLNPTNGILLVARLDGPTADIARGLVDKALAAETNGLWGRAYFDLRNITNSNYKLGDEWIGGAAQVSSEIGFETIVDNHPETFPASFPMSQIAIYCGWYDGNVSGPFTRPNVEFMPGAFAYHLHSSSAASIRTPNQFWVGPLLAKGATCTMGCVNEPYLTAHQTSPFFSRAGCRAASVLAKPHGHRNPFSPGKPPLWATRSIVRSASRRKFCTPSLSAITIRCWPGHFCGWRT
ncbi:MAG: TIGR03790 family protein [Limisphaerales bacterium]